MKIHKSIKILIVMSIVLMISFVFLVRALPNIVSPYVYSLFGHSVKQVSALHIEKGVEQLSIKVPSTPTFVQVSTFPNNKKLVLVTSMKDSSITLIDIDTEKSVIYPLPAGSQPRVGVFCDINNDGKDEIIVPLWGRGNSTLFIGQVTTSHHIKKITEIGVGNRPRSVVCGDLDSDGYNELISADNYSDTLSIIDNEKGTLTYAKSISVGREPGSVFLKDMNNDSLIDILVAHRKENNVYLLENKKGFLFKHTLTLPTLKAPKDLVVLDVDNNNTLDVVTIDGEDNNVSVFYLQDNAIRRIQRLKVSGSPHSIQYIQENVATHTKQALAIASYPNWIEVLSYCSGKLIVSDSLWFGWLLKRKILYISTDKKIPNSIFIAMAGIDSIVHAKLPRSGCDN